MTNEELLQARPLALCMCTQHVCLTQPRLQNLDQVPVDQLRPEFVTEMKNLRGRILGQSPIKTLNGKGVQCACVWMFVCARSQPLPPPHPQSSTAQPCSAWPSPTPTP